MMGQGLPGIAVLPGMAAMGMVGAAAPSAGLPGVPSQSPSAAANAALEAALSGTAFGAIGNGMGGLPQMGGGQVNDPKVERAACSFCLFPVLSTFAGFLFRFRFRFHFGFICLLICPLFVFHLLKEAMRHNRKYYRRIL